MNILIASSVFPATLKVLRKSHDVIEKVNATDEQLKRLIKDREVLIFRSGVDITSEVMACAPNLKLLIRAGSGLDNIDLDYAREHGIHLARIPEPGARAVAELAFSFMLTLARQVSRADSLLRKGHWAKNEITGYLLANKTLGIIGAGNIGTLTGRMGIAWDMNVKGCVEHPSTQRASELEADDMKLASFDEILSTSDFISLHVPLTDTTRNLIDADALGKMKPGAFLINMARGGVVDEAALYQALKSGQLAGAGMDVHAAEGEGKISPLAGFENVILTPHMGAGTVDSQQKIGERIEEIISEHATA